MRFVLKIAELVEELGSINRLAEEVGVGAKTIKKMVGGRENWRLDGEQIARLTLLARRQGVDGGIFAVEYHELWETFAGCEDVKILRNEQGTDAEVERELYDFLQDLGASAKAVMPDSQPDVEELIKNKNCIFIGSPKANPLTSEALDLLYRSKQPPFSLHGRSTAHASCSSKFVKKTGSNAIKFKNGHSLDVRYWPEEQYEAAIASNAPDAACIVVCRQPMGTERPVTTIVICGFTGLATAVAANALMGEEPPLDVEMPAGKPLLAGYSFRFRKVRKRGSKALSKLRELEHNSGRWVTLDGTEGR